MLFVITLGKITMSDQKLSSYERVRRTVDFQKPDRIPMSIPALGIDDTHPVYDDILIHQKRTRESDWVRFVDEWGCTWERTESTDDMGTVVGHPLANWTAMETFSFPDPYDSTRWATMEAQLAEAGDKYVVLHDPFCLWERACFLHGTTSMLEDLYLNPDNVRELLDQILAYRLGVVEVIADRFRGHVHCIFYTDDWGSQNSSMISIPMWRQFFKPLYKKLFETVHEAGMHVYMHSCGYVNDIVGEWIEIGLDMVNLQQPRLLGIEEMGRLYQGDICFCSPCDIQQTLPSGTREEIEAEAALLLEKWATPDGGFMIGDYNPGEAIGVSNKRRQWMVQAFRTHDPYRK